MKTGGFGPSGETRLHLRLKAQIEDRLGQALAGGAHPRRICFFESLLQKKNAGMAFSHSCIFGCSGNYGYNSQQQFGECTPPVNFVPHGVFLYPSTNFCAPSDKSVPQEVPGIPELSVR